MIEVEIEDDAWGLALPHAAALAEQAATRAIEPYGAGDVIILLTNDASVQDLNARFRAKDQPTNVLSFPAPETARPHLGDIALAFETCAREAAAQNKPLEHHLQHLTVHGVLHLLGYDHQSDAEAEEMEAMEREILSTLDVPDPYALFDPGSPQANA